MEAIQDFLRDHSNALRYVVAGTAVATSVLFLGKKFLHQSFLNPKGPLVECPPDTVLLVQISRGPFAPSMSPFPLKLETYLKMAGIPYVTDVSGRMSSKNKTPWIMYNGQPVADSQFCMEFLNKTLHKDLNSHLSKAERASAEALRIMVDEHTYWCMVYFRWIDDKELATISQAFKVPKFVLRRITPRITNQLHGQGMGRHTAEEVLHILRSDLQVLADYLGDKKFMTGDIPCEVDCSVFGLVAQFYWQNITPRIQNILKDYPSLEAYCERMKERFWPDWDDYITHGLTRKAIK